jgi:type I restriction enzyme R subunit
VFDTKVQAVYDHVLAAYGDDGTSVYTLRVLPAGEPKSTVLAPGELDVDRISDAVVERIRTDPQFAAHVAAELDAPGRQP